MFENFFKIDNLINNYQYIFPFLIMLIGLFIILRADNLIKKIFGLNVFQNSIIIFYINVSMIYMGKIPVVDVNNLDVIYINPLPQVLMLTAIVVGVALMAVAFALIVKINHNYNTISETIISSIESSKSRQ